MCSVFGEDMLSFLTEGLAYFKVCRWPGGYFQPWYLSWETSKLEDCGHLVQRRGGCIGIEWMAFWIAWWMLSLDSIFSVKCGEKTPLQPSKFKTEHPILLAPLHMLMLFHVTKSLHWYISISVCYYLELHNTIMLYSRVQLHQWKFHNIV